MKVILPGVAFAFVAYGYMSVLQYLDENLPEEVRIIACLTVWGMMLTGGAIAISNTENEL